MTRWSMPPESWWGYFLSTSSGLRMRMSSSTARDSSRMREALQSVCSAKVSAICSPIR